MPTLEYKPDGDVLKKFMKSNTFFRGIRGPVGSGKSVSCCIEVMRRAMLQEPNKEGLRRTRWAVIRNTNPQLRTTTIKTWLDWFPENVWGKFNWSVPYTHVLKRGEIEAEVIFLALDRPEDVRKLLSLELTGVFINEAREVPKSIVDACTMRVGRFPSMRDGGPTWYGVIADTNAPEEDHWWPVMAGDAPVPDYISAQEALMMVKPDNWEFYTQPCGMNEVRDQEGNVTEYERNTDAENVNNLQPNYYSNIIRGKSRSWIDVYVMNRLGMIEEGKPVYNQFNDKVHISKEPIPIPENADVHVGLDFGLTPAAAFCVQLPRGRWAVARELVATDMGTVRFAELLRHEIATTFPTCNVYVHGDPAGDMRAQTDETTPFQILRAVGLQARPAPSNDVALRLDSVNQCLTRMVDGSSGLVLDPACVQLIKGFQGGYHYRRMSVSGDRYEDRPFKNKFSHIHDALQYALLGAGEGRQILGGDRQTPVFQARRDFDVFTRKPKKTKTKGWATFLAR